MLVNAIAGHHNLSACQIPEAEPLAARVAVANAVCDAIAIPSIAGVAPSGTEGMWEAAGLSGRDMAAIIGAFFETFHEADQMILTAS